MQHVSELLLNRPPTAVKVERSKKTSILLLKRTFFSNVQLWRLVSLDPVGVQRCTVPHFKDLIVLYLDVQAQGRDTTFIFHHAHLKKAILYRKTANRPVFKFGDCTSTVSWMSSIQLLKFRKVEMGLFKILCLEMPCFKTEVFKTEVTNASGLIWSSAYKLKLVQSKVNGVFLKAPFRFPWTSQVGCN